MSLDKAQAGRQQNDTFAALATQQFILLKTFRKNGVAVPTPVWFVFDNGKLYVMTIGNTGKVKRIRNNGHVLLTPCDRRGNVLGDGKELEGQARELSASEQSYANIALAKKYGFMYQVFMLVGRVRKLVRVYIEIVPA